MQNRSLSFTGLGLIFGAALGIVIAGLSGMIWVGGAGVGVGLVVGAAIDAALARRRAAAASDTTDPREEQ
jgi:hypothetical protein